MTIRNWQWPALALAVFVGATVHTAAAGPPAGAAPTALVEDLMRKDLTGVPGKELQMLTVTYPPGGASPPHSHHAQVFVYVLSGSLRMQVQGSPVVTLRPGQTFYEGVDDVHSVSENASRTEPAKFLVFLVRDRSAGDARRGTSGNTPQ